MSLSNSKNDNKFIMINCDNCEFTNADLYVSFFFFFFPKCTIQSLKKSSTLHKRPVRSSHYKIFRFLEPFIEGKPITHRLKNKNKQKKSSSKEDTNENQEYPDEKRSFIFNIFSFGFLFCSDSLVGR